MTSILMISRNSVQPQDSQDVAAKLRRAVLDHILIFDATHVDAVEEIYPSPEADLKEFIRENHLPNSLSETPRLEQMRIPC
jgi:hypothetical protein